MSQPLNDQALDQVFRTARSVNFWTKDKVSDDLLRQVYDLAKFGATSANASPARFVFVSTPQAKARLEPLLSEGNRAKSMAAPVTVIIGHDLNFAEQMPKLFPSNPDARHWFSAPGVTETTAMRNGTLQGAYLMLAARMLGLDCGPMSGFDNAGIDAEFFAGTQIKSNFLCNLGYGSDENVFPRSPRLDFEEACQIV
jgi:3-hydroxypropanoate dehydrogenase